MADYYNNPDVIPGWFYKLEGKNTGYVLAISDTFKLFITDTDFRRLRSITAVAPKQPIVERPQPIGITEDTLLKAIAISRAPELGAKLFN